MSINVTRSSMPPFEEFCEEIRPLWESHWLTNNGAKALELQDALKRYWGCPQVELFTNGHLALEAVFAAMGLEGEVITTPFTFASTVHAITRRGLTPVFCDIREEDFTLNPALIEEKITPRTRAIVPVHVYGTLCDTEAIDAIAKKYGLKVIYDAAHTFGVQKDGVSSACFGDAAMFSFHATKVFHTIEGGAVTCADPEVAARLRLERNFGITGPEDVISVGGNAKMNEFQAAMGLCNLRHLDAEIEGRKAVHECYTALLSDMEELRLLRIPENIHHNYAYYPVVVSGGKPTRDAVCAALAREGIFARKYFYPLITDFECYRGCPGFDSAVLPVAKRVSDSVLTLPLYSDLPLSEAERIAGILRKAVRA